MRACNLIWISASPCRKSSSAIPAPIILRRRLWLTDWLAGNGWDEVFLDFDPDRCIAASQRWEEALHGAARRCEAVIFLITSTWLASPWCGREYHLARSLNKPLFGLIADPALSIAAVQAQKPEFAATWQMVDLCAGTDAQIRRAHLPGSSVGHCCTDAGESC